jgi:hypothetical protein
VPPNQRRERRLILMDHEPLQELPVGPALDVVRAQNPQKLPDAKAG